MAHNVQEQIRRGLLRAATALLPAESNGEYIRIKSSSVDKFGDSKIVTEDTAIRAIVVPYENKYQDHQAGTNTEATAEAVWCDLTVPPENGDYLRVDGTLFKIESWNAYVLNGATDYYSAVLVRPDNQQLPVT